MNILGKLFIDKLYRGWIMTGGRGAEKVNRALTFTSPRGHIGRVSSRVHLDSASFPTYLGVPVDHVLVLCSGHLCCYSTVLARPRHCTSHDLARHRSGSKSSNSARHRGGSSSARHRGGSIVQKSVMRQCGSGTCGNISCFSHCQI